MVRPQPVRDDHAFEAPLLLEDPGQEDLALTARLSVEPVVCGHHRPHPGLLDGSLESWEVDLAECALGHDGADVHAVLLLVLQAKCFTQQPTPRPWTPRM